jgi:hypothetical protein
MTTRKPKSLCVCGHSKEAHGNIVDLNDRQKLGCLVTGTLYDCECELYRPTKPKPKRKHIHVYNRWCWHMPLRGDDICSRCINAMTMACRCGKRRRPE